MLVVFMMLMLMMVMMVMLMVVMLTMVVLGLVGGRERGQGQAWNILSLQHNAMHCTAIEDSACTAM